MRIVPLLVPSPLAPPPPSVSSEGTRRRSRRLQSWPPQLPRQLRRQAWTPQSHLEPLYEREAADVIPASCCARHKPASARQMNTCVLQTIRILTHCDLPIESTCPAYGRSKGTSPLGLSARTIGIRP